MDTLSLLSNYPESFVNNQEIFHAIGTRSKKDVGTISRPCLDLDFIFRPSRDFNSNYTERQTRLGAGQEGSG
jgi:hypothetical protein